MPLEVLNEHLVDAVRCRWVAAGVSHRAPTAVEILPHYHRNFPQSWVGSRGTRRYHAVVEELVIQRVWPAGRSVLIDRHGGVVREVCVPEHFEHVVTANLRRSKEQGAIKAVRAIAKGIRSHHVRFRMFINKRRKKMTLGRKLRNARKNLVRSHNTSHARTRRLLRRHAVALFIFF